MAKKIPFWAALLGLILTAGIMFLCLVVWHSQPQIPLLLGCGVGIVTAVCATAGAAGLMVKGAVGLESMGLWAAGITVGAGLLGSLAAMLGGGGPLEGVLAALGELVVLFGLNGVLCGGEVEGAAVKILALAGGCGAAVLLRMGKRSGSRHRRRRSKNR